MIMDGMEAVKLFFFPHVGMIKVICVCVCVCVFEDTYDEQLI